MMMWKKFLCTICCSLILSSAAVADTGADVVLVEQTTQVVCKNKNTATIKKRRVYEILNERGKKFAAYSVTCDNNDKLTSFSAVVTNASGNEIKKIKKGDLKRTEFSADAFATDSYDLYFSYTPPAYPVTVTYELTQEIKGSLVSFPTFVPQPGVRIQVKHAKYVLTAPADMGVRYKAVNLPPSAVVETKNADNTVTLAAEVSSLDPIPDESYSLPAVELLPTVYFAPGDFNYLGTTGNCSTCENFGKWQYGLLEGRDILPDKLKEQLHALTDTCTDNRSKIALVYKFLEQTTRYVSIQLGIGGLQPAPAADVYRTGFGDCKGLTNYMHAMLKEVGVNSVYCTINMGERKDFYPDFADVGQSNHVILCVPEATDSLWIECTNASLPLGYVHSDIAGHNAIAIDAEGGHLVRLPEYADTLNLQSTNVDVTLAANGSAQLAVLLNAEYKQYEILCPLSLANDKTRKEWLLSDIKVPHGIVTALRVNEQKKPYEVPAINVEAEIQSAKYAGISGKRLLVPLNPTHRSYNTISKDPDRKGKMYIRSGYRDIDSVTIHIPEGYVVEEIPAETHLKEEFGEFDMVTKVIDAKTIMVSTTLTMRQGTYSPETFTALYNFKKKVKQQFNQKIVIKPQ